MYFGDEKTTIWNVCLCIWDGQCLHITGVCLIGTASVGEGLNTQLFDLFVACLIEVCVLL